MTKFDVSMLHDILHCVPASSLRHSLVLTTWLLALQDSPFNRRMFESFVDEIKKGRWHIDKGLFRALIKHGDSDARFNLLVCSLEEFLTRDEREKLFLIEFEKRKHDLRSMEILSEVLYATILLPKDLNRVNRFRKQIDYFVAHPSFKVRQFGVVVAVYLNPPQPEHFKAIRKGLFHSNYVMRLQCINSLEFLLYGERRVSKQTIDILKSLNFADAIVRFAKRSPELSSNAETVLAHFKRYGF